MNDTTKLRIKRAAYWALPVTLTGAAIGWTTVAAGGLLAATAPDVTAYTAAVLFDAVWLYAVWADRRNHLAANPDRTPALIGWIVLLISMAASLVHGVRAGDLASGILGAALPLLAKMLVAMAVDQDTNQVTASARAEIHQGRQQARDGLAKSRAAAGIREDALSVHAAVQRSWKAATDTLSGGKQHRWSRGVPAVDAPTAEVLAATLSGNALAVAGPFTPITAKPVADDPHDDDVTGIRSAMTSTAFRSLAPAGFGFGRSLAAVPAPSAQADATVDKPMDKPMDKPVALGLSSKNVLGQANVARASRTAERIAAVRAEGLDADAIVARWGVSAKTAKRYLDQAEAA